MEQPEERRDRYIKEHVHDPYHARMRPEGPLACPSCGAIYADGRWQWADRPGGMMDVPAETCPACRRTAEDAPAGIITISGPFAQEHRDQIIELINNQTAAENAEHPMNRLIAVTPHDGGLVVTTTDLHMARRLGEALYKSFKGDLSFDYAKEEYLVRVTWAR